MKSDRIYIDPWYLKLRTSSLRAERRSNPGSTLNHASEPGLPRCARNDEIRIFK